MNLLQRLVSDWTYVRGFQKIGAVLERLKADEPLSLADEIEKFVDANAGRTFIEFEGERITFAEFDARASRFANWARALGLRRDECVALFLDNRPDYIAFWAGMAKIGVRTALINYNLSGPGLAHCLRVANARAIVMAEDLAGAYASAEAEAPMALGAWTLRDKARPVQAVAGSALAIEPSLETHSSKRPDRSFREGVLGKDIALFIYTSGTTGLPKAAKITHARSVGLMQVFIAAVGVTEADRILMTLPLYHATGGMCAVGCALFSGATLILERKFSASQFWRQAIDTRANMMVYIGEFGRYLMNQPASALEKSHAIVKGFGNGLRPDVWAEFVERTGIKRLVEFYGSTEGNVSFFNLDGRVGAVGRIPPILKSKIPAKIVKFDVEKEEPVRGPDGFCIEAEPGETGEAIGPISDAPRQRFEGYNDEKQTRKKILTNVFATGDKWFRTGDLMKKDRDGYIYFVDRVGDTFRWKSENVSTGEVELAISAMPGVEHAVVYGVAVPGQDGKAGMAAITAPVGIDLKALYANLARRLPAYARPVFVRLRMGEAETTGTLKYRKVDLVQEAFDPLAVKDPLYVSDPERQTYAPIDLDMYRRIVDGHMRL